MQGKDYEQLYYDALYENRKLNTSGQQKAPGTCERIRTPF